MKYTPDEVMKLAQRYVDSKPLYGFKLASADWEGWFRIADELASGRVRIVDAVRGPAQRPFWVIEQRVRGNFAARYLSSVSEKRATQMTPEWTDNINFALRFADADSAHQAVGMFLDYLKATNADAGISEHLFFDNASPLPAASPQKGAAFTCSRCKGTGCLDTPFSGSDPSCPDCSGEGELHE